MKSPNSVYMWLRKSWYTTVLWKNFGILIVASKNTEFLHLESLRIAAGEIITVPFSLPCTELGSILHFFCGQCLGWNRKLMGNYLLLLITVMMWIGWNPLQASLSILNANQMKYLKREEDPKRLIGVAHCIQLHQKWIVHRSQALRVLVIKIWVILQVER